MKSRLKMSLAILVLTQTFATAAFAGGNADTYKGRCSACHGVRGVGDTTIGKHLQLRDLGSPDVQKQTDDELTVIIAKGKGKMPAFSSKLKKEDIAELVKLIRSLKK